MGLERDGPMSFRVSDSPDPKEAKPRLKSWNRSWLMMYSGRDAGPVIYTRSSEMIYIRHTYSPWSLRFLHPLRHMFSVVALENGAQLLLYTA